MVTEVFQEVLELWRSFVPLTPKMFSFLLPMFLEDVLLTLEGLWLGFERVKQVLKKPHRPHIGVSVVFEGIPSIISNNLTDLSKSVCGPIFLKHDRLCYIIIKCTGGKRIMGFFTSHPTAGCLITCHMILCNSEDHLLKKVWLHKRKLPWLFIVLCYFSSYLATFTFYFLEVVSNCLSIHILFWASSFLCCS